MIQTEEQILMNKKNELYNRLVFLGGSVEFENPIKYRETPHTPTVYIYELSIKDDFNEYNNSIDTILQRLRLITRNIL